MLKLEKMPLPIFLYPVLEEKISLFWLIPVWWNIPIFCTQLKLLNKLQQNMSKPDTGNILQILDDWSWITIFGSDILYVHYTG